MRTSKFSEEQIIGFLRQAEAGMPIKEIGRKHGFSDASFYKWRSKYGGMDVSEAKRLRELELESGKLKLLAVSSAKRNAQLGDVPTVNESLTGFLTGSWQGLLAPAGTPKAIADKLNAEIARIMSLPDIKERLATLGAKPNAITPEQFANWFKSEIPAMAKIVKDGKVTVE